VDLERAGDFLLTAAASGAGEARGDGRGEDIARGILALRVWDDSGGCGKSWKERWTDEGCATLYPSTDPNASHHV
jgi:hypothetical protein